MADSELDLTIAHVGVARLQALYGDVVTRQEWSELSELFTPDCVVRLELKTSTLDITGPEELGRFIGGSLAQFEFFTFTIVNSVIDIAPGCTEATSRMYIRELRQGRDDHRWTTALGLYRDTYAKVDGRWWFTSRLYSSLARGTTGESLEVFDVPR